ncbi:mitotic checkpoint protein BUB3 [Rhizoclosmatium globosum]|uniref:Mitotic checkpoint protein BUB3 n=1 Tax=Rhizoclosmatium globosum TaxID=329046 RepID=A0A1Y2C7S3_9FUNG|nr:hypothetical protein HDU79_003115 [Rhizoclosmatium sp. JEL0117]ORY43083.1 mitotic checkpoint protein BUB3 [Rhizoclosmatium globosum]|eukprot:ORY43083.1 mitotic checkpoint protein BUB3 [Rhizoclosmatium globosum]
MAHVGETELLDAPRDTVSSVKFSAFDSSSLLVSSWDKSVRLYDAAANRLRFSYSLDAAVLGVAFADQHVAVSGGLDKKLNTVDLHTSQQLVLGAHEDAVKCVAVDHDSTNLIASGSWDKSVKLWDLRTQHHLVATQLHPHKVHSIDATKGKLVVATADRRYYIYDLRNLENPLVEERVGSLKYMTRCVSLMPNGDGYATASIEGRISVEFFDNSESSQARKYAFKCHREKMEDGIEKVFPVNALAFHPIHGTFVSGGSDGNVFLWDGFNKKRLRHYPRYPTGVSALSFNRDGNLLAVGCSYTYEEGEQQNKQPDAIYIRPMGENETRPKTVAPQ